tara:strand:+ start:34 stop:273 length:240 start_codon:yes stop_codon:yes gene_type:complete
MKTVFNVGDLVRFKEDSWWLKRSANFRNLGGKYSPDSLVLVTDDLVSSQQFFYGIVCGDSSEAHLWSHDQFDLVQAAVK